jgi:hypothetical protein
MKTVTYISISDVFLFCNHEKPIILVHCLKVVLEVFINLEVHVEETRSEILNKSQY